MRSLPCQRPGVNDVVPRSDHYIQFDQSEIMIDATDQTISIANDQSSKL